MVVNILNNKHIGNNIKKIRKERGLSQIDLADKVGISRTYMSDIERGAKNASMKTIVNIANVLDVDISKIMSDTTTVGKKEHIKNLQNQLVQLPEKKYRFIIDLLENFLISFNSENEDDNS